MLAVLEPTYAQTPPAPDGSSTSQTAIRTPNRRARWQQRRTVRLRLDSLRYGATEILVKGRAAAGPGLSYSAGIGMEYWWGEKLSFQLLFNVLGYDDRRFDGPRERARLTVPEVRYRITQRRPRNRVWWTGLFGEFGSAQVDPSGEIFMPVRLLRRKRIRTVGVLLGKNFPLGRKAILELYVGPKLRFSRHEYVTFVPTARTTEFRRGVDVRGGLNLAVPFR